MTAIATIRRRLAVLVVLDLADRDRHRVWELDELARHLDEIQAAIDEHAPGPRAQQFDRTGGGGGLVWCDDHERPVATCHRREQLCEGVPLARHVDPTGDTATGPDSAHAQRAQLARVAANLTAAVRTHPGPIGRLLEAAVRDLHGLDQWRRPMDPTKARVISDREGFGDGEWCQSHQRIGVLEPRDLRRKGRTDVAGRLRDALVLCRRCVDRIEAEAEPDARAPLSKLVPVDELEHHHRHGRWRPIHVGI